jgi:hypothetical protein
VTKAFIIKEGPRQQNPFSVCRKTALAGENPLEESIPQSLASKPSVTLLSPQRQNLSDFVRNPECGKFL